MMTHKEANALKLQIKQVMRLHRFARRSGIDWRTTLGKLKFVKSTSARDAFAEEVFNLWIDQNMQDWHIVEKSRLASALRRQAMRQAEIDKGYNDACDRAMSAG